MPHSRPRKASVIKINVISKRVIQKAEKNVKEGLNVPMKPFHMTQTLYVQSTKSKTESLLRIVYATILLL